MAATLETALVYLGEKAPKKISGGDILAGRVVAEAKTDAGAAHRAGHILTYKVIRAPQVSSRAVEKLAQKLAISEDYVLVVSDISNRTYSRRLKNRQQFTEAESDRVLRVARIAAEAERVFGDGQKSGRWLSTASKILGARPLDLLATDAGAREVEYELTRIEHGDFS